MRRLNSGPATSRTTVRHVTLGYVIRIDQRGNWDGKLKYRQYWAYGAKRGEASLISFILCKVVIKGWLPQ